MKYQIPRNLLMAESALIKLDRLVQAKEWQRAAIVAAFVRLPGRGYRSDLATSSQVKSANEFAAIGFAGLRSKDTVRHYVQRWLDEVGRYPKPGATVELPSKPWLPTGGTTSADRVLEKDPDSLADRMTPEQRVNIAAAILRKTQPEDREQIAQAAHLASIHTQKELAPYDEAVREAPSRDLPIPPGDQIRQTVLRVRDFVEHHPDHAQELRDELTLIWTELDVTGTVTR